MHRARIGLHYLRHFKVKGVDYFSTFELLVMLSILLLRCGDVQPNPGPPYIGSRSSEEHDTSVSSSSGSTFTNISLNYELIKDKFSVIHYNVQSLSNKVESLESELFNFQILCLTETWLNQTVTDDDNKFSGYNPPFRRDRQGDSHGGICVYVNENLSAK